MRRAHPLAAELLATLFFWTLTGVNDWDAAYWSKHGVDHWLALGLTILWSSAATLRTMAAWRLIRDGRPA